jgi:ornithine carbamoyltransferase
LRNPRLQYLEEPIAGVRDCDVLYTDVWVSMGKEAESNQRLKELQPFQVNRELIRHAAPGAIVLHCLPAYRGKEITEELLEEYAQTIFDQAENRLHAQKAILTTLAK